MTQEDIDELRRHHFSADEIFDIALAVAARNFFSKTLDALGAEGPLARLESRAVRRGTSGLFPSRWALRAWRCRAIRTRGKNAFRCAFFRDGWTTGG